MTQGHSGLILFWYYTLVQHSLLPLHAGPYLLSPSMVDTEYENQSSLAIPWRISLLGGLRAERGDNTLTRFRSQKFAALLAYLALFPRRVHTREELADLLWPDADVESARGNLRTALASLRRDLEPEDVPSGAVLDKRGHVYVRLEPSAIRTDVTAFEEALHFAGRSSVSTTDKMRHLLEAVSLYKGPLLPGFYEPWALSERDRLAEAYVKTLFQLSRYAEQDGDLERALDFARRASTADPLNEDAQGQVLRLLMASGQASAARRHFESVERLFETELDSKPSAELRELLNTPTANFRTVPTIPVAQPVPAPLPVSATSVPSAPVPTPLINLPTTFTRFFGRESEVAQIQSVLSDGQTRLLTITGPGGSGKTRLGIEAARTLVADFPGGICLVPLTDVPDAGRIFDAIADSLGIPRSPSVITKDQVIANLRQQGQTGPTLLVMDNFEHLAEEGVIAIETLLHQVPELTCLVTSRLRLQIDGEQDFPLAPLPTPHAPGSPERLMEFSSVQLFVNRAKAGRADFALTERNAAAIADLCARLEGIPLAIELAAAWAPILTPAQILARLNKRFDLLVARRRDAPERHRTLRAAVEWSFQALPPDVRDFFVQLSVFRGGWTLETAEAITGEPRTLEYLSELRDRSLIIAIEEASLLGNVLNTDADMESQMRFRMLETLREFAAEQILDANRQDRLAEQHFNYFLSQAKRAELELRGPHQLAWLRLLEPEHDNLRAALTWSLDPQRPPTIAEAGMQMACCLVRFWLLRSHFQEGRAWLEQAIARNPDASNSVFVKALIGAGRMAWRTHDYQNAILWSQQALPLARSLNDRWAIAFALNTLGGASQYGGEPTWGRALLEESVATARELNDPWVLGHALYAFGHIQYSHGEVQKARESMEESLALLRLVGDTYGMAETLRALGMIMNTLVHPQYPADAIRYIQESISLFRQLNDVGTASLALLVLGFITTDAGDHPTAIQHLTSALNTCREIGDRYGAAHALHNRGQAYMHYGDMAAARADLNESLTIFADLRYSGDVALSLQVHGEIAFREPDWEGYARLMAASTALRLACRAPLYSSDQIRIEPMLAQTRAQLGDDVYNAVWNAGQSLNFEESVAYALKRGI